MPREFNPPAHAKRKTPYTKSKPSSKTQQQGQDEKQHPSVNDLKRRIRDSKRLLSKPDLPADKRIIQERALKGYEKELADEEKRRERSKMIKKYHFVRFLDRKTATKEVNRLTRKQNELIEDESIDENTRRKKLEKVETQLHTAKVNLNYTIYYPLTEKYISIYAERKKSTKDQDKDQDGDDDMDVDEQGQNEGLRAKATAEKKAMWLVVERCMSDGTLDQLREGKLSSPQTKESAKREAPKDRSKDTAEKKASSEEKTKEKTVKPDNRKAKRAKQPEIPAAESGDESDGGFFEM
ncbi:hypothetical protein BDV18DRAFT_133467 [Aspergillus unguis]